MSLPARKRGELCSPAQAERLGLRGSPLLQSSLARVQDGLSSMCKHRPSAAVALAVIKGAQRFSLNDKILKTIIALGGLIAFAGLLALPSALSGNKDPELLGTGLAFFGMGAVLFAMGFYFQARALRSQINADPNLVAALQGSKRKGTCDSCKAASPVIQCTMHRVNLCTSCLVQHYDSRGCVYVPAVRKTTRSRAGAAGR